MGIKTRVLKWADRIGKTEAKDKLMAAGISYSVTAKLISGNYGPEPKIDVVKILEKLIK